ncbi:hypothetical protein PHYPSEUDO_012930 [Phytophthora pseudosyringae]|uniref:Uncharacterized protein n=1 Tax=Phytophthora pseudosyringae TaxID=221518 RepID=A0A8T1V5Z5_9STRA|nr:hypothetical protein PHYPSEUDO_012930 [Phytophthora pseudosyringae]
MEGYLIRVPVEACFPDSLPAWRQRSDASGPVYSQVLYYIVAEGYLRGYESPDTLDDPMESFQLTSHRIEVNAMYSLNVFEIKARAVNLPPSQQFVEDTSSSSSDSSDDGRDSSTRRGESASLHVSRVALSSTPRVVSGSYHVVFFAPNKELVKKWSVKLLNWNRYVFSSCDDLDEAGLELSKAEIIESLRVVNAADRFLRFVQLRTTEIASTTAGNSANAPLSAHEVDMIPAPVDTLNIPISTSSTVSPTETTQAAIEYADVVKPFDALALPLKPWWVVPFGKSRRISSYSLRR